MPQKKPKNNKPIKPEKPKQEIGYVKPRELVTEMQESYIDYAMSVIVARALPDVRDGFKPVHRRILFAMHEDGLTHGAKFRKSATVVGSVLGRYHPHGDVAVYDSMARMAQDFSLRYPMILGQGNWGCFTKDTEVKLSDGRNLSFGELIKEREEGKKHWGFTFNFETQKIEIAEIKNPRLTRKNEKLIEIILDNKEKIQCTPNHRFMLRNGSYREAENLRSGDSLMPIYTNIYNGDDKNLKGYELVYQPIKENEEFVHHLADEWNLESGVYKRSAGRIRHHKDFNKLNNNPDNILRIQWQDHWKYHKEIASWRHKNNIVASNKRRTTNLTGKKKFLRVCQYLKNNNLPIDKENFERARKDEFKTKSFTSWDLGIVKYYNNDHGLVSSEIKNGYKNHKVIKVKILRKREDVYDLTIEPWHNFALATGVFVHNSIDGDRPAAMRYCVTGDTLVITENGLMPIKEISSEGDENIKKAILSKDKNINIATKWFDSGEHPTIKITTQSGLSLRGSHNHPILVWSKNSRTGRLSYSWKLLSHIKLNDIAVIDRTSDILWPDKKFSLVSYWPNYIDKRRDKKILPEKMDESLAFILGALVSEGTIKNNEIEFCNGDSAFVEHFIKNWSKVFPDCRLHRFFRRPNSFGKKPYQTLEIHSRYVVEFLRNIGLDPVKSSQKKIPFSVLRSPKPVATAFLSACFEGDGSISFSRKMTELSYISMSDDFINSLQVILLRFGIASAKRYDKWRKTHKLYIRGLRNYKLFKNEIDFVCNRKKEKLEKSIERLIKDCSQTDFVPYLTEAARSSLSGDYQTKEFALKHNFDRYSNMEKNYGQVLVAVRPELKICMKMAFEDLLSNNYLFDPIKKIEFCGKERVYSLRVDSNCHSFVGNGFINHNTECKMSKIGEEMLRDLNKNTVEFIDNYDTTRKEPKVLPSPAPQLLLNGSLGIAVGMATNIPPHNLTEVVDASIYLLDHPKADTEDLFKFVQGPDFPTGGNMYNAREIMEAYSIGKGAIVTRGKIDVVEIEKTGRSQIIITEIPYQVVKSSLIEQLALLVQDKKIDGIKDIRDESDREGLRIVIDLQKDAYPKKILNRLYKFSDLQKTFHLNMLALVDGIQPRVLSLVEVLNYYLLHRKDVITRRINFDLMKAKERAHILEGLHKCLANIDLVIKIIKSSQNREDAMKNLMARFRLTEIQANAILETKLAALAKLERKRIEDELRELMAKIKELMAILKDPEKIKATIKQELKDVKDAFGDERRTKLHVNKIGEIAEEDLIPQTETIITLTQGGYIKRIDPSQYKNQKRGGKGMVGMKTLGDDVVEHFLTAMTHDSLLFFADSGKVFRTQVYEIPEGQRVAKGRGLLNFLELAPEEKILSLNSLGKEDKDAGMKYLIMVTKNGIIKKTALEDFDNVRKSGLIAISLKKGDSLKNVRKTTGENEIVIITKLGQSIHFKEKDIRSMGRTAAGIRGIRLSKGDEVIAMDVVSPNEQNLLLVVSENGYGKRTSLKEYKVQSRGGSGIKTAQVTSKTGSLVYSMILKGDEEDLIIISEKGQVIRTPVNSIAKISRATQGVRIMRLDAGDKVASAACV